MLICPHVHVGMDMTRVSRPEMGTLSSPVLEWRLHSYLVRNLCCAVPAFAGPVSTSCFSLGALAYRFSFPVGSRIELRSSGLPACAFTYLLSHLPGPPYVIFMLLFRVPSLGDKNSGTVELGDTYFLFWSSQVILQPRQCIELYKPAPQWNLPKLFFKVNTFFSPKSI